MMWLRVTTALEAVSVQTTPEAILQSMLMARCVCGCVCVCVIGGNVIVMIRYIVCEVIRC